MNQQSSRSRDGTLAGAAPTTSAALVSVVAHVVLGVLVWNALQMPAVFDQLDAAGPARAAGDENGRVRDRRAAPSDRVAPRGNEATAAARSGRRQSSAPPSARRWSRRGSADAASAAGVTG